MSQKRAIATFLSQKFMITCSSIAFEDFLGSSIAPQVMPPCSALHCFQSRRRRQVSLCPRERELLRSALANFARSSAEQRGRRENRAALLVAGCTKSGRAEWTGELDGRWWEVGDGRWDPQIPGLSPPQCTRPPICTPSDSSCLF